MSQLLHSLRVAPKAVSQVLPDTLEACASLRTATDTWMNAVNDARVQPARRALSGFCLPLIAELEAKLRESIAKPMNAKSRLALEEVVAKCAAELNSARELLELVEDALFASRVRLDPRELVRETFTARVHAPSQGGVLVSAMLSSYDPGSETEINPQVAMALVAFGVELVGAASTRETPHVLVSSNPQGVPLVRITRKAHATGEPLVLQSRGVREPTLPCVKIAAALADGHVEWEPGGSEFVLRLPAAEPWIASRTHSA
ncbi:MAG TPA: hypothetical protein VFQ61_05885 [Polyangiaceae bacterium]|nr:hypothetical protein [Polyangiaceae bacterium]